MKQAGIYVNNVFCGTLTEDEEGYHFCYAKEYLAWQSATPVSPTMPLTEEQYDKEMIRQTTALYWKSGKTLWKTSNKTAPITT